MDEAPLHLYGFSTSPFVKGLMVVGTASQHSQFWLTRNLIDGRTSTTNDEKSAAKWLEDWCGSTSIIKGTLYPISIPNGE
jgi:hypothetical protein